MTIHPNSKLLIFFLTLGCALIQTAAEAEERDAGVQWVLTGDTVHLDRSTRFLANGYSKAAIRHAKKALRGSQSPLKTLIANHNLCIAWHLLGDQESARSHCEIVRNTSIPERYLKHVNNRFYKVSKRNGAGGGLFELNAVIAQNMRHYDGSEDTSRIVQNSSGDR